MDTAHRRMEIISILSARRHTTMRELAWELDVAQCFWAIIEDREELKYERVVDGYAGFLFTDKNGYPEVAMHWEHRFNHMVKRYNGSDVKYLHAPRLGRCNG